MDPNVRAVAEDQTAMAGLSAEVAEETMKSGEKTIHLAERRQGHEESYKDRVLNHEERLNRKADREEKKAEKEENNAHYNALAEHSEANNPVGVDRDIANTLMSEDIDEATIEAILRESPEFQELVEIQGEEKAREYLNLIVDDAARQQFLDEMQEQIQEAEILDQEEEQ